MLSELEKILDTNTMLQDERAPPPSILRWGMSLNACRERF